MNSSGAVQWTADGVAICSAYGNQNYPRITSDGLGGAVITWDDSRSGAINTDIYAQIYVQRVNSSGAVQWTADGVAVSTHDNPSSVVQHGSQLVSDGSAGAIIAWEERLGENYEIYAQRVNSSGVVQWSADGARISPAVYYERNARLISDGSAGAIITWQRALSSYSGHSSTNDIYAQRVNSSGNLSSDTTPPTVTLTSTATSPTNVSPIPMTATFSEAVTGFVVGDITVGNGTAGNFVAVSSTVYTFDVTPAGKGAVTVSVATAVAQDAAANGNTAASQYSITYSVDDSTPLPSPAGSVNWGLIIGIIVAAVVVVGAVAGWLIVSRRKA